MPFIDQPVFSIPFIFALFCKRKHTQPLLRCCLKHVVFLNLCVQISLHVTAQPQDSINHVSATEAASNFIKKSDALELAASGVINIVTNAQATGLAQVGRSALIASYFIKKLDALERLALLTS